MSTMLLYEKIVSNLRAEIAGGVLKPGDKIPGIAELRQRFGVSHITVLRVYREMLKEQMICRHGHGYSVAGLPATGQSSSFAQRNLMVGLFMRPFRTHSSNNYFNEINLAMEQALMTANLDFLRSFYGNTFVVNAFNFSEPLLLANLESLAKRCAGVLIDERLPDSTLAAFLANNPTFPAVLVNRWTDLDCSCVTIDNVTAINEQISNLARLGYERVIYLHYANEKWSRDSWERLQTMRELASKSGNGLPKIEFFDRYSSTGNGYLERTYSELMGRKAQKTAVITPSDTSAQELGNALLERGLVPGRNFGLAGFYRLDTPLANGQWLSTMKVDTSGLGRTAVEILMTKIKLFHNRDPMKRRQKVEFVFGDTI